MTGPDFSKSAAGGQSFYDTSPSGLGLNPAYLAGGASASAVSAGLVNGVTGVFDDSANVVAGTGFTVVKTGGGAYTVTFVPALSGVPSVVASSEGTGVAGTFVSLNGTPTAAGFAVVSFDTSGVATDAHIHFHAIVA